MRWWWKTAELSNEARAKEMYRENDKRVTTEDGINNTYNAKKINFPSHQGIVLIVVQEIKFVKCLSER